MADSKSDTPRMLAAYNRGSCPTESLDPVMDEGCNLERELAAEKALVEKLQRELCVWLPCIAGEKSEAGERAAEGSYLLAGYMGPLEPDAEERGWIVVTDAVRSAT